MPGGCRPAAFGNMCDDPQHLMRDRCSGLGYGRRLPPLPPTPTWTLLAPRQVSARASLVILPRPVQNPPPRRPARNQPGCPGPGGAFSPPLFAAPAPGDGPGPNASSCRGNAAISPVILAGRAAACLSPRSSPSDLVSQIYYSSIFFRLSSIFLPHPINSNGDKWSEPLL